jgi:tetratricopeptide (TPR) repeat protein
VTRRPRSHTIETESERAFEALLPLDWTCDEPTDYGIDRRVQIFLPDGSGTARATGHEFGAQLKATDSTTRTIYIPIETFEYWQSLSYPVLLVRYLAPSKALYARWLHERIRGLDPGISKTSVRFEFNDADLVTDVAQIEALVPAVIAFENARRGRVRLPLRFRFDGPRATAAQEARWNDEIERALGPGIVVLDRNTQSELRVTFDIDQFGASVGGGLDCVVHGHPGKPFNPDHLDVIAAVGACLGRAGSPEDAVRCFRASLHASPLRVPLIHFNAVAWCSSIAEFDLALTLLETHRWDRNVVAMMIEFLTHFADQLDGEQRQRVEDLQRWVVETAPSKKERGQSLFRQARMLRSFNLHIEAHLDLVEALNLDRGLAKDAEYWFHRGGSAFLCGQLDDAVESYRKSIDLGAANPLVFELFADALLEAGRYADLLDYCATRNELTPREAAQWLVALRIIERFGIEKQARSLEGAQAVLAQHPVRFDEAVVRQVAEQDAIVAVAINPFVYWTATSPEAVELGHLLDLLTFVRMSYCSAELVAHCLLAASSVDPVVLWGVVAHARRRLGTSLRTEILDLEIEDPELEEHLLAVISDTSEWASGTLAIDQS